MDSNTDISAITITTSPTLEEKMQFHFECAQFEIDKGKFQVEKDKFELEKATFRHEIGTEKDKIDLMKRQFDIEKVQIETERGKLNLQREELDKKQQYSTNQIFHHDVVHTFGVIPSDYSDSMLSPTDFPITTSILLTDGGKLIETAKESIIRHAEDNVKMFDIEVTAFRSKAKKMEALFEKCVKQRTQKATEHLTAQLQEKKRHIEQLESQITAQLGKIQELENKIGRINEEGIGLSQLMTELNKNSILHQNIAPAPARFVFITIENLNKTIIIGFNIKTPLLHVLWTDPTTALFSILKNDWDNDKIPKVLDDNRVKLFVSSSDICKGEWVQINGAGQSICQDTVDELTFESFFLPTHKLPTQAVDNDRCPQGKKCSQREQQGCEYHFGSSKSALNPNCVIAHNGSTFQRSANYHLKLKWHIEYD